MKCSISCEQIKKIIRSNLLTFLTIIGVISGIVLGALLRLREEKWSQREIMYVNFIGDIFLRMLKGLIIPLIVSSLVAAVGSLNLNISGKIGVLSIIYYLTTTILAVILGIILVVIIKPGVNSSSDNESEMASIRNVTTVDTLLDLVRNIFPPNIVQACTEQYQTVLIPPADDSNTDLMTWTLSETYSGGTNILGIVLVSCVFGVAIGSAAGKVGTVLKLFEELCQLMMKITGLVIWCSPVGVMFLIAAKVIEMDNIIEVVGSLGLYFVTVLGGLIFHGYFVLPMLFLLFTRTNPYKFLMGMTQAMATAFGTSSSSATLPVTIQCMETNLKIDPRVSRFVIPIGATINMDGTALYEAVAAIFIAQLRGISLTFGNIIGVSITATAASIGAAGIPQAGLVTMVMVLDVVGLPAEDVSLIIAVDWLLDRFRTIVNVTGDGFGAGIIQHLSKKQLQEMDEDDIIDSKL